jgi:hypothetical protein
VLEALVGGQVASPDEAVAWTDADGRVIGGVVTFTLPAATSLEGNWLGMRWQQDAAPGGAYESLPFRANFANVSEVRVFVDLDAGVVAGVKPGNRDVRLVGEMIGPDGRPIPPVQTAGGD